MSTSRLGLACLLVILGVLTGCAARNIWEASRNGNAQQVRDLLAGDPELVHAVQTDQVPGDHGNKWTPLHYAAAANQKEVVRILLDAGADPLAAARGGWTPIHAARQNENQDVERMLIQKVKESGREMP